MTTRQTMLRGVCLQILALPSAICTILLGCSCGVKVAQQNDHSLAEVCGASRAWHTQRSLLCLERAEGLDSLFCQKVGLLYYSNL